MGENKLLVECKGREDKENSMAAKLQLKGTSVYIGDDLTWRIDRYIFIRAVQKKKSFFEKASLKSEKNHRKPFLSASHDPPSKTHLGVLP